MSPETFAMLDPEGLYSIPLTEEREERLVQISIARSLMRIADNLDLVINHNTYPSTSIAVSSCTDRG